MHLLLHPFTRERKKTHKKPKRKKKQNAKNAKNQNAYFQERRRIFSRTETQKKKNENEDANSRRTMST